MTAPARTAHPVNPAELKMLQLIASGLTVQQIARREDSTASAVAMRLWRARNRIGAVSNAHAIALLARDGQIDLSRVTSR